MTMRSSAGRFLGRFSRDTFVRVACVLTLIGLLFMVWSVVAPAPISLVVGMSVGQGLGVLGMAIFAIVVLLDLRKARVLDVPADAKPAVGTGAAKV